MAESSLYPEKQNDALLTEKLPEAIKHPEKTQSIGWQLLLSLANLVVWISIFPTFQILLPDQIAALDPANKVTLLAAISLPGGIAAILGNLLAGALSDRTTSRFGRRRPWILGGAISSAASLVLLAFSPSIALLALGVILFQFCVNLIIASLAALVPDQVPVRQRATVSGFAGLALPLGTIVGLTLVAQAIKATQLLYFVLSAVLLVVLTFYVFFIKDAVLPAGTLPPISLGQFLAGFFRPLRSRDFTFTWIGRILVIFGYYTVVGYLLFYLQDVVHYDKIFPGQTSAQGVALFQLISTGILIIATIISGIISDRLQRRKAFVIAAALIIVVSLIIIALFPVWPMMLTAAGILGLGFGILLSGDLALQTQVLPDQRDRGKDLGIQNTANLILQVLVPLVVALVLALIHSYAALFIFGAILTCIGAMFIFPIRSVR
ncbi:MFS transporter [Ktedonosporobacter rubrisoli]|uniref:MFS transporter n=1 Tax=Ktedonosporobacter rubrisoli TaxID=2509675 RepID=A0A4P6K5D2_KTERU|nr:MFS transporter [Ktedonosporobacter rubrisoli]QBD82746.1 MFS transporter [Ktedonosporobacter rubrisoli]